jgi:putative N6-adenine-specific DNA methylase
MIPSDFHKDSSAILITCPKGLASFCEKEVRTLGMNVIRTQPSAVLTTGNLLDCMKLNLCLATAHHVLYKVLECTCRTPDELYLAVAALSWERLVPLDTTLCVTSTVKTPSIKDTRFANLRCKDAIVDRLAEKTGRRCNSGPRRDGVVVHLYWQDERCMLYLDTSGETLSRRGYRTIPGIAPMQETLAAGVVRATGWSGDGSVVVVNPMCGSGTLAIEAALLCMNRKPGMLRENFGFMHYTCFDKDAFANLRNELASLELQAPPKAIIASDINARAIEAARKNSRSAGVDTFIEFRTCDIADTPVPPDKKGIVLINPEYGFRMGTVTELETVYKRIGDFLKLRCAGYTGYVFTGNFDLIKKIGLKSGRKMQFFSGKIECRLYEYELYNGRK